MGPFTIPITSGAGAGMNNPAMEGSKNLGPLPRGKCTTSVKDLSKSDNWGVRTAFGDWGSWRVPIKPLPGTNVFGRDGFFLHGGKKPGSKGCVDYGGGNAGNNQTWWLYTVIKLDPDGVVNVTVE